MLVLSTPQNKKLQFCATDILLGSISLIHFFAPIPSFDGLDLLFKATLVFIELFNHELIGRWSFFFERRF